MIHKLHFFKKKLYFNTKKSVKEKIYKVDLKEF